MQLQSQTSVRYSPRIPQASEVNPVRSSSREPLPEEASEL